MLHFQDVKEYFTWAIPKAMQIQL
uniref:Uncharacterized protein n=1 Tax=Rhizophora mucronata TaxID=61149 RepID=A0A2P2QGI4_RHIMU